MPCPELHIKAFMLSDDFAILLNCICCDQPQTGISQEAIGSQLPPVQNSAVSNLQLSRLVIERIFLSKIHSLNALVDPFSSTLVVSDFSHELLNHLSHILQTFLKHLAF